jgi:hypothetical protein
MSNERFYGYICIETFTKEYPDESVTYEKDKHYPTYLVANLPRAERNRHFIRNTARRGDAQVQA